MTLREDVARVVTELTRAREGETCHRLRLEHLRKDVSTVCVCVRVSVYVCLCVCACIHLHAQIHIFIHMCVSVCTYMHTCKHAYMHNIHVYKKEMHTYTCTQIYIGPGRNAAQVRGTAATQSPACRLPRGPADQVQSPVRPALSQEHRARFFPGKFFFLKSTQYRTCVPSMSEGRLHVCSGIYVMTFEAFASGTCAQL
jgi:hypothetical protein